MSFRELQPAAGRLMILIWVAGVLALVGTTFAYLINDQPYPAPWAWLSFIAMMAMDEVMSGSDPDACWSQLPKVTLLAGIIVFRRHPEIIVLVATAAGPVASLAKRQPWFMQVTTTAHWIFAAAVGSALFRLVGFADSTHFVLATGALAILHYGLGPALTSCMQAAQTRAPFWRTFGDNQRWWWLRALIGAGLALAWRTASLQTAALIVGQMAFLALIGVCLGFALRGQTAYLTKNLDAVSTRRVPIMVGLLLLLGAFAPKPLSWLLPLVALAGAGVWVLSRRAFGLACVALGGLCNEVVVGANGGRMPVKVTGLPAALASDYVHLSRGSTTHVLADASTRLVLLADRFSLAPLFPGIASLGDLLIGAGIIWIVAAQMVREPSAPLPAQREDQPAAA